MKHRYTIKPEYAENAEVYLSRHNMTIIPSLLTQKECEVYSKLGYEFLFTIEVVEKKSKKIKADNDTHSEKPGEHSSSHIVRKDNPE